LSLPEQLRDQTQRLRGTSVVGEHRHRIDVVQAVVVGGVGSQLHADVEQSPAIERLAVLLLDDHDPPPHALLAQHCRQRGHELREMVGTVAIRNDDRQTAVSGEGQRAEHAAGQQRAGHAGDQFPVRDADGGITALDAQSL
jgi:hypothetical protein